MQDRTISATCVFAYTMWALAVLLALGGTLALAVDRLSLALTIYAHNALLIGGAVVVSIRAIAEKSVRHIVNHVELRGDVESRLRQVGR